MKEIIAKEKALARSQGRKAQLQSLPGVNISFASTGLAAVNEPLAVHGIVHLDVANTYLSWGNSLLMKRQLSRTESCPLSSETIKFAVVCSGKACMMT
jgi:hypothetical protein